MTLNKPAAQVYNNANMNIIRNILIGSPLPTGDLQETSLNKVRALAAFSPDALSSIAYANQEIFLALAVAGSAGLSLSFPIGITIAALLVLVALSYFQTIQGYPSGGGSYIVARQNIGTLPGLIAGAALLVDYTLVSAVSITAGIAAIASSFPVLWNYQVELSLVLLLIITLINLRGARETGTVMGFPVYFFLLTYLSMLVYGAVSTFFSKTVQPMEITLTSSQPLTTMLVLQAFAAGCTALTGIEAISNGVPAFKEPRVKNAGHTLLIMALLMAILFVGSIGLTQYLNISPTGQETILSALARHVLGTNFFYILVQIGTLLILTVAANTSYSGFPRLAAILAKDRYLPNQLVQLGDRLVYSNGILVLAGASAILIIIFKGDSHALIPLFAVGAFLAFTLSQSGMVIHWFRGKGAHWQIKILINALGAVATFLATIVIAIGKFSQGAWISLLIIPLLVLVFLKIEKHYRHVFSQLKITRSSTAHAVQPRPSAPMRLVIPVSGIQRSVAEAVLWRAPSAATAKQFILKSILNGQPI